MRIELQPALILHKRAYRETSLQLEVLTRDYGIVSVLAKGLTGTKKHILRAQLQALQHVKICFQLKPGLSLLTQSELLSDVGLLSGERLMAGLYFNELVLKLSPKQDADNELFQLLLHARNQLQSTENLAWLVRQFERDLIQHLGYLCPWTFCADHKTIMATHYYRLHVEMGLLSCTESEPGALIGREWLNFVEDVAPCKSALSLIRQAMHSVITLHLGKSPPRSWQMIGELSRPLG